MTKRNAIDDLFGTEWATVSKSAEMIDALTRWRSDSNGAVNANSADDLVAVIQDPDNNAASRGAASWLLEVDERLARRVVVQSCIGMVLEELKYRMKRSSNSDDPRYETLAAAIVLAVGDTSGSCLAFPHKRILQVFKRKISDLRTQDFAGHLSLDVSTWKAVKDPEEIDYAVELTRVLKQGVDARRISETDAQILWLTTIGGVTPAEVADAMVVAPSTIRKRRARAQRSLEILVAA